MDLDSCFNDALTVLYDGGATETPDIEVISNSCAKITYHGKAFLVSFDYENVVNKITATSDAGSSVALPTRHTVAAQLIRQWYCFLMTPSPDELKKQIDGVMAGMVIDACPLLKTYKITETDKERDAEAVYNCVLPLYEKVCRRKALRPMCSVLYAIMYIIENYDKHCYICGRVSGGYCGNEFCRYQLLENPLFQDFESRVDKMPIVPVMLSIIDAAIGEAKQDLFLASCPSTFRTATGDSVDVKKLQEAAAPLKPKKSEIIDIAKLNSTQKCLLWWLLNIPRTNYTLSMESGKMVMTLHVEGTPRFEEFMKNAAVVGPKILPLTAYHGSRTSSWISILYTNIQILSNTSHMRNGAVHGPGIYTATNLSTAQGYAAGGGRFTCIAEVDVLPDPAHVYRPAGTDFCVVKNNGHILLRRLHIFGS